MTTGIAGVLVAIEGIDGSGKSTQCELLSSYLRKVDVAASVIKAKNENQNKAFKEFTKAFGITSDSISFAFLYQALHRRQFELARRELDNKKVVIADRWNPSFFVFHNLFGHLAERPRARKCLDDLAFEGLKPDICFLLNVPVRTAFQRRSKRKTEPSPNKQELGFYRSISAEYHKLAAEKEWVVINAQLPVKEIHRQIILLVKKTLREKAKIYIGA